MRELNVQVKDKTAYAVQVIVRDPSTGVYWSEVVTHSKPLAAQSIWMIRRAEYHFATNERQIAAFHLTPLLIDARVSGRRASSLADAEEITVGEVVSSVESSWPITNTYSKHSPTRVVFSEAFGTSFMFDGDLHPTLIELTLTSVAFEDGQWVVSFSSERGETGLLVFSEALKFIRAEERPKESR